MTISIQQMKAVRWMSDGNTNESCTTCRFHLISRHYRTGGTKDGVDRVEQSDNGQRVRRKAMAVAIDISHVWGGR